MNRVFFVLLLWLGATFSPLIAGAQAPNGSLEALLSDLRTMPSDPHPEALTRNSHYVVSDERRHDVYADVIRDMGGVFLGVGTNQNYEMMAWARSEVGILLDFDQMVVDLHLAYRVIFQVCETPKSFVAYWRNTDAAAYEQDANRMLSDPEERKRSIKAYAYSRKLVARKLRQTVRRDREQKTTSFVTDIEDYKHIVSMIRRGQIVPVRGDLTATKTMKAVAKILKKHGRVLDLFYVSNCEQYFDFPEHYRANMVAQPSNEKALVLRSRPWREFLPGTRDPKGPIRYTFTYQPLSTFQQWMKHPKVKRLYDMISRDRIVGKAVSFTKPPPEL